MVQNPNKKGFLEQSYIPEKKQQQQQQSKELTNQKNETILNAGDDNDNSNKSGKPTIINITASNINDDEQLTEA